MIEKQIGELVHSLGDLTFEDQTVLVTGGAGFLGSWCCDTLIAQGASVICLDNIASGRETNINHLKDHDSFRFEHHDISQPYFSTRKIDFVFHLASRASPFEFAYHPIQILKSNTLGTMIALGIAKKHGADFLFSSTSETYGDSTIVPTPETYRGNVNTIGPRGCYDEAKRAGEAICMAYQRQHGLNIRIARIFNTYGPRMRCDGIYGRVTPRFVEQAINNEPITIFGDGSQTRSFCYVTDQVSGLFHLALVPNLSGEVVNIGNPIEITIKQLAEIVIHLTGSNSELSYKPLPEDDPKRRCPVIEKAKELLGWTPKVGLDEGLQYFIDFYRQNQ